jgi:hypothetical protein
VEAGSPSGNATKQRLGVVHRFTETMNDSRGKRRHTVPATLQESVVPAKALPLLQPLPILVFAGLDPAIQKARQRRLSSQESFAAFHVSLLKKFL